LDGDFITIEIKIVGLNIFELYFRAFFIGKKIFIKVTRRGIIERK